jgi:hypothetical protein
MKKLLLITLLLMPVLAQGAGMCLASRDLSDFVATLAVDPTYFCTDQDKIYSNFQWSGQILPGDATIQIGHTPPLGGIEQHNVVLSSASGFLGAFTFGFTISVDTNVNPLMYIIAAGLDIAVPGLSPGSPQVIEAISGYPSMTAVKGAGSVSEGVFSQSLDVVNVFSPNGGYITNLSDGFIQGQIPEPVSIVLVGFGLIGIGWFRRRK